MRRDSTRLVCCTISAPTISETATEPVTVLRRLRQGARRSAAQTTSIGATRNTPITSPTHQVKLL